MSEAMHKDIEKRKMNIWLKVEKWAGIPFVSDPKWKAYRQNVEDNILYGNNKEDYWDDFAMGIESAVVQLKSAPYFPKPKEKIDKELHKTYQKTLERRVYLVNYVLRKHIMLKNRNKRDISLRSRINWEQMYIDWNKEHPCNPMTKKVLKDTFYRAIKEREIQDRFFDKLDDDIKELFSPNLEDIKDNI